MTAIKLWVMSSTYSKSFFWPILESLLVLVCFQRTNRCTSLENWCMSIAQNFSLDRTLSLSLLSLFFFLPIAVTLIFCFLIYHFNMSKYFLKYKQAEAESVYINLWILKKCKTSLLISLNYSRIQTSNTNWHTNS